MWFRMISLGLSAVLLAEGLAALLMARRFHWWLRQELSGSVPSAFMRLLMVLLMTMAVAVWYATFTHYVRHGWAVTVMMTLVGVEVVFGLTRWRELASAGIAMLETPDCLHWGCAVALGLGLAMLGLMAVLIIFNSAGSGGGRPFNPMILLIVIAVAVVLFGVFLAIRIKRKQS